VPSGRRKGAGYDSSRPRGLISASLSNACGIVIEVRPSQSLKAPSPMLLTFSGIVTEVSPVPAIMALFPILVKLSGMMSELRQEVQLISSPAF